MDASAGWWNFDIGLNVFGFNVGARDLYEKLGYAVTSVQMKLEL